MTGIHLAPFDYYRGETQCLVSLYHPIDEFEAGDRSWV
jgi:hypothetical protein